MSRTARRLMLVVVLVLSALPLPAQFRVRPVADETGSVALQLLFRKLHTAATLMMTDAHPDDENNALLAQTGHGLGLRTVLVTATRGDGGQNEIGPEIFDGLAVLRTEELLAVHRFDGAEQFFTRAVDFGYSFSMDETYEKWGADQIIGDYVRLIRTIRPDVIVGFLWEGNNGGLHHQASTHLTADAFRAAADPTRYPEQIKDGLRPWQARKFYYTGSGAGGGGGAGGRGARGTGAAGTAGAGPATGGNVQVQTSQYDPVLGRTYDEIGSEARTMHKCQGTSQLPALPGGGRGSTYHLQDCTIPGQLDARETSVLDGVDLTLAGVAQYASAQARPALVAALAAITRATDDAEAAFRANGLDAAVPGLASGLHQLRALRAGLATRGLTADEKFEIDFRLEQKERQFQQALVVASALRIETLGNDPMVTPGQTIGLQILAANRGKAPVTVTNVTAVGFQSPPVCPSGTIASGAVYTCGSGGGRGGQAAGASVQIPRDAKPTDIYFRHDPTAGARYTFDPGVPFGVPFAPTPFRVSLGLTIGGEPVTVDQPVEARYEADHLSGEKRTELLVVPAFSLTVAPDVVIVPTGAPATREVRVTVRNNTPAAASADVRLHVPAGWSVTPASIPVAVGREDEESTIRFMVTSPAGSRAGATTIGAEATSGSETFKTGFQIVEYPHIRRRLLQHPADASVKIVDLKAAPARTVGYIMGVGDKVPEAIAQLGDTVSLITPDELAWGNLAKYPVIMVGVRAYERREDLRANNQRLLDYVKNGGVALLNYQRTEFNQAQYGPYPATTTSNRITDENAPMKILAPDNPVFHTPNDIGPDTWASWVQERGTYFLAPRSPEYVDLLESADPFPDNAGPKRGILVEASYGKGTWVYIGLVLWRELPAGVPGAYQLLDNLISLGK